jgi:serine/threonine protein kinase
MVMEYEDGTNLQHIISKQKGGLSEQLILTVFPPLLDALQMIHERGFLHQDIKPGNIHICPGGSPRLLDFGAVQRRQVSRQYQPGQVTSSGFSPIEQHNKTGYVGPWTDIYAIGATIRSCIEGKPPPDAQERHMKDTMKPSVAAFKKQYSIKLLEALDWALEVDPELRPQTILEFKDALPPLEEKPESFGSRLLSKLTRSASLGRN